MLQVFLNSRGDGIWRANAGYYRDAELARRLFADEATGRLREGTVRRDTRLAETLLGTGATGGDPEIVRMALAGMNWPREDPRWYWKLQDPLCFWNHMPGIPTANPEFDRGTYLTCFRLVLERRRSQRPSRAIRPDGAARSGGYARARQL